MTGVTTVPAEGSRRAVAAILRYGSRSSALLMALGLALGAVRGLRPSLAAQPGLRVEPLFQKLVRLDPLALTEFGILVLLVTPVLRIIVAAASFALEGDYKYFFISLGVLAVVLVSIGLAVG